jgi:hypothetical protein
LAASHSPNVHFWFRQRVVGCRCQMSHGPGLFLSPPAPEVGAILYNDSWPLREGKDGPQTRISSNCCNPDTRRARHKEAPIKWGGVLWRVDRGSQRSSPDPTINWGPRLCVKAHDRRRREMPIKANTNFVAFIWHGSKPPCMATKIRYNLEFPIGEKKGDGPIGREETSECRTFPAACR